MFLREIYDGIKSEILKEILDYENIADYEIEEINDFEYKFKTVDDSEVYIQFQDFTGDEVNEYFRFPETFGTKLKLVYNTAFSVDGDDAQAKVADLSYTLPIFKTITKINKTFISKINPDCITVFATSRTGEGIDAVKLRIWKLNATKHRPTGYNMSKCFKRENNEVGFCLYKNSLLSSKRNDR